MIESNPDLDNVCLKEELARIKGDKVVEQKEELAVESSKLPLIEYLDNLKKAQVKRTTSEIYYKKRLKKAEQQLVRNYELDKRKKTEMLIDEYRRACGKTNLSEDIDYIKDMAKSLIHSSKRNVQHNLMIWSAGLRMLFNN